MNNLSITKSNSLVKASYRLSLNETRILLYGISLINPMSDEFPLEYKINIQDFSKMFNIKSKNIYSLIKNILMDKFWNREFTFVMDNDFKMRARWLTSIKYADQKGYLKIFINPQLEPFLHHLKRNFTTYYIEQIIKFQSIYSIRLYELFIMQLNKNNKKETTYTIDISHLKENLELPDKYKRFCSLKEKVLDKAKKEINDYSNIDCSYAVIKNGRTPEKIKFNLNFKDTDKAVVRPVFTCKIKPITIEKAKKLIRNSATNWDIYAIEDEFHEYISSAGPPKKLEAAFLGFVKKKIQKSP